MDPVVHFEMPYEDKGRMAKFYTDAFGWETQMLGEEMGGYVVAHTAETDEKGMIQKAGAINGGFYKKPQDPAGQAPSVVIAIEDIKRGIEKVKAAGGEVLGEPMEIPGIGLYASFRDTEGNRVSMLQPNAR
jgi:predicted enzyme related to lactoylglutathione lyase